MPCRCSKKIDKFEIFSGIYQQCQYFMMPIFCQQTKPIFSILFFFLFTRHHFNLTLKSGLNLALFGAQFYTSMKSSCIHNQYSPITLNMSCSLRKCFKIFMEIWCKVSKRFVLISLCFHFFIFFFLSILFYFADLSRE